GWPAEGSLKKLDPQLRQIVRRHREAVRPDASEYVWVGVEFRGELAELEAHGFSKLSCVAHPQEGYKIATGTVPVARLEELAAVDHVGVIEAPSAMRPVLNYSAKEIKALAVNGKKPGGATGRGVVVGIIDTGIEYRHGAFFDANGKTRILSFWDMNA